ncbi:predicted protein [Sclerotinia sclerotiorum 1980 UF-70]|uniref:Ecp2 effector protein domain-containing protein n=2 Tax=Sclerotinia sclerotiorum (strain ATCC 18683 / 1980 / Ss-1) TaxID=665079 RepID=A7E867_SCLS1|nr:predicted protein [Sclerotinia sclerotiorum 1980 UF-70]APA06074.1 hypothetical protein sscle_01g008440 [Sclerotinia sclerotiorum 1980 UF-70]EDN96569.1 predicted protein [Sclerotinia sclerotiorum 1980 UF-70]
MYLHLPFITAFLVSFASAQSDVLATIGDGPGPWQNASYFKKYNQSPNATGSGHLYGVNTSLAPSTDQIVSWDTRINVTEVPWTGNQTVTNTVISFDTKNNIFPPNSSWETCMILFSDLPRHVTVKGQNDPGDCTKLYSKECISDFNRAILFARQSATNNNSTGPCGGISLLDIVPKNCEGSIGGEFITANVISNKTDGSAWMYKSSNPHDSTDLTFYEKAVTQIWPMLIMQSPNPDFQGTGVSFSNLSCLRAKNISSGSEDVKNVPAAGSRMVLGGWTLFVVMSAMSLLL